MKTSERDLLFGWFNEIGIISQLSSRLFEQHLPQDLTLSQFGVLNWFVRVDSQATPGRLSTAFQVTKGAMTNTLKKLEQKQLVVITPDEKSGRSKIVRMTSKGRQVRDQAIKQAEPLLKEFGLAFDTKQLEKQLVEIRQVRQYLDDYRYQDNGRT